jgi:cell division protein FtsI (penicillin-binding protein 3)
LENKKDILSKTYLVYILLCVFSIAILYKIAIIQFKEGEQWKARAEALNTKVFEIEAVRGNIFDANGNLLATSLPYYEIAVDINAPSIDDKLFESKVDSLGYKLAQLFQDKPAKTYVKILRKARKSGDRYVVIKRNVSYKDLQTLKTFPIFKKGKRGGLVTLQTNKRERPFKILAARTIGMARKGIKPVGLEGAFDSVLTGVSGKRLMQKIAGDVWRPINDENEVEPKDGSDLFTTIDINIQDVAENALLIALQKNKASYGCVVLMEVKTGEIKAIANLTKTDTSNYYENINYAIGFPTEPGSTFKLASMLAVIDDYNIDLEEKIQVGNGECMYFDRRMKDSHAPETPIMSAQRSFETSSNVGISKLITKYYTKNPKQFIEKLNSFGLNTPLELSIPGEGIPRVKQVKDKDWYGTTLPWMSIGYESLITPMQTLTLYNAIANDGKMVRPRFVKNIQHNGKIIKEFEPEIINEQIVKAETVKKAKLLMEGVVENGTGRGLNITAFKVGGKTGTAQIAVIKNGKLSYGSAGERMYQASFVGYFPADKPLYTCIVIINSPSNGIYYGGLVAGPVFKEIAEKVYSNSIEFIEPINIKPRLLTHVPHVIKSNANEITHISKSIGLPIKNPSSDEGIVYQNNSDTTSIQLEASNIDRQLKKGLIPNLTGLSAKDALFILENNGLHVKLMGMGSVKKQSIEVGQKYYKGDKIILTLSS